MTTDGVENLDSEKKMRSNSRRLVAAVFSVASMLVAESSTGATRASIGVTPCSPRESMTSYDTDGDGRHDKTVRECRDASGHVTQRITHLDAVPLEGRDEMLTTDSFNEAGQLTESRSLENGHLVAYRAQTFDDQQKMVLERQAFIGEGGPVVHQVRSFFDQQGELVTTEVTYFKIFNKNVSELPIDPTCLYNGQIAAFEVIRYAKNEAWGIILTIFKTSEQGIQIPHVRIRKKWDSMRNDWRILTVELLDVNGNWKSVQESEWVVFGIR